MTPVRKLPKAESLSDVLGFASATRRGGENSLAPGKNNAGQGHQPGDSYWGALEYDWLVVWNMNFIFHDISHRINVCYVW